MWMAAVVIALSACAIVPDTTPTPQPPATATPAATPAPTAPTAPPQPRNTVVSAEGVVQTGLPAVVLSADVGAKVVEINVEPGQRVKRGDVLGRLDDTSLRDALQDAQLQLQTLEAQIAQQQTPATEADLASARAALSAAQLNLQVAQRGATPADLEQARIAWEGARASYLAAQVKRDVECGTPLGKDIIPCQLQEAAYGNAYESERNALERYTFLQQPPTPDKIAQARQSVVQARTRLEALEAGSSAEQLGLFEAQKRQARSAVKRAQDNLINATVLSPCDCVVQEVNASVGVVPRGNAFTLIDTAVLQFRTTNLSEQDLGAIQTGDRAVVRLRAFDARLDATVASVVPQSSSEQGSAAIFTVILNLDAGGQTVLPGMTGQVEITSAR
jgi:multidrug efflux pump subunit AcrA (membrane-fusion protein)